LIGETGVGGTMLTTCALPFNVTLSPFVLHGLGGTETKLPDI
jgi:hypothetical protein